MAVVLNKQNDRIYGACLDIPLFNILVIYKQSNDIKIHHLS